MNDYPDILQMDYIYIHILNVILLDTSGVIHDRNKFDQIQFDHNTILITCQTRFQFR